MDADDRFAPLRTARALVVGGTGFIGRSVVEALARAGCRDLHWSTRDPALAGGETAAALPGKGHRLDLREDADVRSLVAAISPVVTFNLAGYGVDPFERDEEEAALINDRFVGVIARAVAAHRDPSWRGLDLVHVGSALEYGAATGDLDESTEPRPTTLYGSTKLAGTRRLAGLAKSLPLRAVTARLFMVYGPGEHAGRLVPSLLATAARRTPLELTAGTQQRDFTYVGDAAEALLRLALASDAKPGEVVNVATGKLTSVRDVVERAGRAFSIAPELLRIGALPTRRNEMQHEPVAVRRLRELVGWIPPTGVEEGLRRTAGAR